MSKTKHTPGPWYVHQPDYTDAPDFVVCAPDNDPPDSGSWEIAHMCSGIDDHSGVDPQAANARLVAAAPELFAMLEDVACCMPEYEGRKYHTIQVSPTFLKEARDLIAKAKGEDI